MLKKTLLAASLATLSLASSSAFAIENVDILIKNGQILTMDRDRTIFDRGLVVIKDNKIVAVTDGSNIGEYKPAKTIDVDGDIVMPGLINTHTHASMTVFRSLADDVPDRLHRYIFPLEKKLVSREMVRIGAQLGNVEMVKGGVTTYADMHQHSFYNKC
ncbi:hypothetical protein UB42_00065 [Photobacterium leiognathi]|nr:hypothetical protein UB42_00065 [Photobacterium leiognathi]